MGSNKLSSPMMGARLGQPGCFLIGRDRLARLGPRSRSLYAQGHWPVGLIFPEASSVSTRGHAAELEHLFSLARYLETCQVGGAARLDVIHGWPMGDPIFVLTCVVCR